MAKDIALEQRASEMGRVRQIPHGEVVLFNKLSGDPVRDFTKNYHEKTNAKLLFSGMLGIYAGVPRFGSFIEFDGKVITVELTREHNYELALIKEGSLVIPFIGVPTYRNCMVLEDRAYIGPDEISAVLKEKCGDHFGRFFADYVRTHRRV